MLDFGATPIDRQLILSAQFLQRELPVRLAHRVAELENLPYGLSSKPQVLKVRRPSVEEMVWALVVAAGGCNGVWMPFARAHGCGRTTRNTTTQPHTHTHTHNYKKTQVRDWYVESFREIRAMPLVKDAPAEAAFTDALRALYRRHAGVVPAMARGVAELRRELSGRSFSTGAARARAGLAAALCCCFCCLWCGGRGCRGMLIREFRSQPSIVSTSPLHPHPPSNITHHTKQTT